MRFSTTAALVGLGAVASFVIGVNAALDLFADAYGFPRDEVNQQIEWYLEPANHQ